MRTFHIFACIFSLILFSPTFAADLDHAKTLFEEKQYESALSEFKEVFESSTGDTRLVALLHILRCDYFLKNHSELASYYNTYISEAENASFEPDIHFQYANSLMDHAKDYSSARSVYEMLYQEFPNTAFAGSGSLLKLGDLDVLENKAGDALSRYSELETNYPNSPYIDNALLGKVKAYAALKDRASLLAALQDIKTRFPDKTCTAIAGLEVGKYLAFVEGNRQEAILQLEKVSSDYSHTKYGLLATIQMADLFPYHNVDNSISLYNTAMQDKDELTKDKQALLEIKLGLCYLVKNNISSAIILFENVLNNPDYKKKYKDKAQHFLNAISNPDGVEAYDLSFDLAFIHRDRLLNFDKADQYYEKLRRIWNLGSLNDEMQDASIPDNRKAQWLYQLAIAQFYLTDEKGARKTCQKIVEEYPGEGEVTAHAEFTIAFLKSLSGRYDEAVEHYLGILERYPLLSFDKRILQEIGFSQVKSGRKMEALITFDGLYWLYPYHHCGMEAGKAIDFLLRGEPELMKSYKALTLSRLWDKEENPIYELKGGKSFQSRFYHIIQGIRIARSKKPVNEIQNEDIMISMK